MKKALAKKLFSILFLSIFFSKMVISVAPIIIAHFDARSVNAVIMQVEIEHNTKPTDVKELSIKEYLSLCGFTINLISPVLVLKPVRLNTEQAKHITVFYPPVPTPPPNV